MTRTDWRSGAWPRGAALSLLAAALLFGCGGIDGASPAGEDPAVTDPPDPLAPAVVVAFAAAQPEGDFVPAIEAAIASTPALWVVADWTGATADQVERLVLTSPLGSVYYVVEIPLAEADGGLVRVVLLPDGSRRATFQLLIWGTEIEAFAEVGTWTATATLLGDGTAGSATLDLR